MGGRKGGRKSEAREGWGMQRNQGRRIDRKEMWGGRGQGERKREKRL